MGVWGEEVCLLSAATYPAQGPSQPSTKWVPGPPSPTLKRPGREVHNLPSSNAEMKILWATLPLPHTFSGRGTSLFKID